MKLKEILELLKRDPSFMREQKDYLVNNLDKQSLEKYFRVMQSKDKELKH